MKVKKEVTFREHVFVEHPLLRRPREVTANSAELPIKRSSKNPAPFAKNTRFGKFKI